MAYCPPENSPYDSRLDPAIPAAYDEASPEDIPEYLFYPTRIDADSPERRYVNESQRDMLIYIGGVYFNNDYGNTVGGCGFIVSDSVFDIDFQQYITGRWGFRLENCGPTSRPHPLTTKRAELRAAIGALEFCLWQGEGWRYIVIATNSEYVASGATYGLHNWVNSGWELGQRTYVTDDDLWVHLLKCCHDLYEACGTQVRIWHIPDNLNWEADQVSRDASRMPEVERYTSISNMMG